MINMIMPPFQTKPLRLREDKGLVQDLIDVMTVGEPEPTCLTPG